MEAGRLRLLQDAPGEAASNMAIDAALLACATTPTLRLYGWRPHAISLGYFQRFADFADIAAAGEPVVRRDTGGGAIHHGDEVTFALALDAVLLPRDVGEGYALLHDAVARALRSLGVRCERVARGAPQSARPADRWCFDHPVVNDLVTGRGKLCGSAQRRERDGRGGVRVLHHGSLVLRRPRHTPFVAAVEDQVEPCATFRRDLHEGIAAALAETLGLTVELGQRSPEEDALAARIVAQRHGAESHLKRR